jgi:hypothetical protein
MGKEKRVKLFNEANEIFNKMVDLKDELAGKLADIGEDAIAEYVALTEDQKLYASELDELGDTALQFVNDMNGEALSDFGLEELDYIEEQYNVPQA